MSRFAAHLFKRILAATRLDRHKARFCHLRRRSRLRSDLPVEPIESRARSGVLRVERQHILQRHAPVLVAIYDARKPEPRLCVTLVALDHAQEQLTRPLALARLGLGDALDQPLACLVHVASL